MESRDKVKALLQQVLDLVEKALLEVSYKEAEQKADKKELEESRFSRKGEHSDDSQAEG